MTKINRKHFEKVVNRQADGTFNKRPPLSLIRYMQFIAILGQVPNLLQIIRTVKRQSSGDISLFGLGVALFCAVSWFVYSMVLRDKPLILSNILGCLLVSINFAVTYIYR
ncbi:SemiSWEET family sugar transporter [Candidatus Paracaedibacter symbiosus]|uniref:SemiSWEET family sugar transporter n=1 Tax=Candidatus Paracaedibacter symbiosus TaxID=244582 RepID=UPI000509ADD3|nr:SemiSWEET family transporter [Candidatus Paracaedibacter symbiosus]